MKKLILIFILTFFVKFVTYSQTPTAVSTKYIPQNTNISSPSEGQIYYNSVDNNYRYYNGVEWITLGEQDNKTRYFSISDIENTPNIWNIATKINSLPTFTIAEDEIPFFILFARDNVDIDKLALYTIAFNGLGKGTYGAGGTAITGPQVFILAKNLLNINDIGDTQVIELGDVGSEDIVDAFNAHTFSGDEDPVQNQEEGYVLIDVIIDSEPLQYLFVGVGGEYGTGGTETAIEDDFVLLTGNLYEGITNTSDLINDGEDGVNPFITALDIPSLEIYSESGTLVGGDGIATIGDLNLDPTLPSYTGSGIGYNQAFLNKGDFKSYIHSNADFIDLRGTSGGSRFLIESSSMSLTANNIPILINSLNNNVSVIGSQAKIRSTNTSLPILLQSTSGMQLLDYTGNRILNLSIANITNGTNTQSFQDKSGTIALLDDIPSGGVVSVNNQTADETGNIELNSEDIPYDNTDSGLTATDVKGAIDELSSGSGGGSSEWGDITGTLSDQTDLQTALNGKQATITGAASSIVTDNLTNNRALISNGSGKVEVSAVTTTELSYVSGVTSAIQTQLNSKIESVVEDTTPQLGGDLDTQGNSILGNSGQAINFESTYVEIASGTVSLYIHSDVENVELQGGDFIVADGFVQADNFVSNNGTTSSTGLTLNLSDNIAGQIFNEATPLAYEDDPFDVDNLKVGGYVINYIDTTDSTAFPALINSAGDEILTKSDAFREDAIFKMIVSSPNGVDVEYFFVDYLNTTIGDNIVYKTTTPESTASTTILLDNAVTGRLFNEATPSTADNFTTDDLIVGGKAINFIDTTGDSDFPTVNSATTGLIAGAPFEAAANYMMVLTSYDGTTYLYYFIKL